MSIIIDGIRIPQGREITLQIDEKGEVYVYDTYPTELHKAIEVPDGHGRLIDADALIDKYGDWYTEEGTEEGFIGTLKYLIYDAPTVIQSDKDGT